MIDEVLHQALTLMTSHRMISGVQYVVHTVQYVCVVGFHMSGMRCAEDHGKVSKPMNSSSQYDSEYVEYGEFDPILVIFKDNLEKQSGGCQAWGNVMVQGETREFQFGSLIISMQVSQSGVLFTLENRFTRTRRSILLGLMIISCLT